MTNNFLFFTIGKAQDSNAESKSFKKYIGVGTARILAVNPTRAELRELAGYEPQEEPVYTGTQEIDGKLIPYVRITFLMKVDPENNNGAEFTYQHSFFVRKQYRKGTQSGKYEVIDGYCNTAWGSEDVVKNNQTIMYANGPAKLIGDYQPAYVNYPDVVRFLKEYLSIGSVGQTNGFDFIDGNWVPKSGEDLTNCAIGFTKAEIDQWFTGNVSTIKEAINYMPNNEVKAIFGIRVNSENGNEYQDMYPHVIRKKSNKIDSLIKEIEETRNNGGLGNRIYEYTPIHEYVVTPTDTNDLPFAEAGNVSNPWE